MTDNYLEIIGLIERVHRNFLEAVKLELDGQGGSDINNVQALILFNIGDAEMTVGDLTSRGCYQGANVSYNLKKLVENNYLIQKRSDYDRRVSHVRLTIKGRKLCERLQSMHERHAGLLNRVGITAEHISTVTTTLRRLEALWAAGSNAPLRQNPNLF